MKKNIILSLSISAAMIMPGCEEITHEGDPADADAERSDPEEQEEQEELEATDVLTATAPDPSATYWDCKDISAFCFWTNTHYDGTPSALAKGDFAISFAQPVLSMLKRAGTYRVKLFGNANFTGNCAVFGAEGAYAASPNLPFPVKSARRMEPREKGCP